MCEVEPARLAHFKALVDTHYGDSACRATSDHRAVLGRDDVDGVVIATPDHWHALQAIEACRAKKHVYCEKPLTRTLDEERCVAEVARTSGLTFQTGSQQRTEYDQRFIDAVQRVRAGRIGKMLTVHVDVGDPPKECDLLGEPCSLDEARGFERWLGPAPARVFSETLMPRGMHGHYPRWRDYREYAGGASPTWGRTTSKSPRGASAWTHRDQCASNHRVTHAPCGARASSMPMAHEWCTAARAA